MPTFDIQHDPITQKFLALVEGHRGQLVYRRDDSLMDIVSTTVPATIGNRGVAAQLVKAALDFARSNGWRVKPTCSYAAGYLRRHPEYADLVG